VRLADMPAIVETLLELDRLAKARPITL